MAETTDRGQVELTVLVLDDDADSRQLSSELFENAGAHVVEAATTQEAEQELIAHPNLDAVSLDISLRSKGEDKDGAKLAGRIRDLRPDLPIIGYSAYFRENDFSHAEMEPFTAYFHRGGSTDEINTYLEACTEAGYGYRRRRREEFEAQLARLNKQGQLAEREYAVLRSFSPSSNEELTIERALTAAGYRVEVILPSPPEDSQLIPRRPFVVWVREVGDSAEFEAEVFGQPSLYGVGETPEAAVRNLLDVFWLYVDELVDTDLDELQGPALSLAHFFEHVLRN